MQQPVNAAQVNKSTVVGQVFDCAGKIGALIEFFQGFGALIGDNFVEDSLARDHNVSALTVQFDYAHLNLLPFHGIEIVRRLNVYLRAGKKCHSTVQIHREPALDALHNASFNRALLVVGLLNCLYRLQALGLDMRELGISLFGLAMFNHDGELIPRLELGVALSIECLCNGHHAFGLNR